MNKEKLLLNDNDLAIILNVTGDDILDMIARGCPHYYYKGYFYFNFEEVMDWLLETIDLGYIEEASFDCISYLESCIKKRANMAELKSDLRKRISKDQEFIGEKALWLYNNCGGEKFNLFCEYMHKCFPNIKRDVIYKYYFALLSTIVSSNFRRDKINLDSEDSNI